MNKEVLLSELDASMDRLAHTVRDFSGEEFNRQPTPAQWSAAQFAGHLLLLEQTAVKALHGPAIPTNRAPDNKLATIKWVMEDETKRQAPDMVIPPGKEQKAEELLTQLKSEREKLKAAVGEADLTEACTAFKHPGFGTLTKLEWAWFVVHHTERHRKQMESRKLAKT